MKIDYISDLHLGFRVPRLSNMNKWEKKTKEYVKSLLPEVSERGEVLILAGDFSEQNIQSFWSIEALSEGYEKCFVVMGNHDWYLTEAKFQTSQMRVTDLEKKLLLLKNVQVLDNTISTYNGVKFAGTTLWYELKTHESMKFYLLQSNDSRYIFEDNFPQKFHDADQKFYNSLQNEGVDVLITHNPPVVIPASPYPYSALFSTDVKGLNVENWVCGHQHIRSVFQKEGTTFYVNPLGYPYEYEEGKVEQFTI